MNHWYLVFVTTGATDVSLELILSWFLVRNKTMIQKKSWFLVDIDVSLILDICDNKDYGHKVISPLPYNNHNKKLKNGIGAVTSHLPHCHTTTTNSWNMTMGVWQAISPLPYNHNKQLKYGNGEYDRACESLLSLSRVINKISTFHWHFINTPLWNCDSLLSQSRDINKILTFHQYL